MSTIYEVLRTPKYTERAQEYSVRLNDRNYNQEQEVVKYVYDLLNKK